jgi:hypothetical protein
MIFLTVLLIVVIGVAAYGASSWVSTRRAKRGGRDPRWGESRGIRFIIVGAGGVAAVLGGMLYLSGQGPQWSIGGLSVALLCGILAQFVHDRGERS